MSDEANEMTPEVDAADERITRDFNVDMAKVRANARAFQQGLHKTIEDYVKAFNKEHAQLDDKGEPREAYGTFTLFTYATQNEESEQAAAVTTGTSQCYSPSGAEGYDVLSLNCKPSAMALSTLPSWRRR